MNKKPPLRPLIPSWLDDFGLRSNQFRVFCHLSRRAGKDGRCHPAASSIMETCKISENTFWKILNKLEALSLVVRDKHYRNSNSYLVATSPPDRITAKETVNREIESPQSGGCQSPQKGRCQSPQSKGRKGIPSKGIQLRKSKVRTCQQVSQEGTQFAIWFKSSLPETINLKANWQDSFAKTYDDLVRLDKRSPEQIREVCRWARTDNFWKTNFLSPLKLRKRNDGGITYFDVFAEKMKIPSPSVKQETTVNLGRRQAPSESNRTNQ